MEKSSCKVFIATSMDGYIADKHGNIDWLHATPNPDNDDMDYGDFMATIDAIIMGRNTYETVLGFDIDWPYTKPVYVLSTTLTKTTEHLHNQVEMVNTDLKSLIHHLAAKGQYQLYIDGGLTIQNFLKEDLLDEIIITTIPILLGGGIPLFSTLDNPLNFKCVKSRIMLNRLVQCHYVRERQ